MIKKRWLALALVMLAPQVYAQDEEAAATEDEKPWSLTTAFVSDYRFRGISQTNEDPAVQLTFNWGFDSGVYLGAFASNVDFVDGDGANFELDLFGGYAWDISENFSADIGYTAYLYPADDADYNYGELIAKLTYKEWLSGTIGYSNDVFASDEDGIYYGLSSSLPLSETFSVSMSAGYYDLEDVFDDSIVDYSFVLNKAYGPLNLSLGYYGTNNRLEDVYGENRSGRTIFGVSTTF